MKRTKNLLIVICLLLVLTVTVLGCDKDVDKPQDVKLQDVKPIEMKLGHGGAVNHYYQLGCEKFKEIVEDRTDGAVKITIYPSNQLGTQQEMIEGVMSGSIEINATSDVALSTFEPTFGILNLPFLFDDMEHVAKVFDGNTGEKIAKTLEEKGAIVLAYWENGFRQITNSKRPIETPDDLKGLKIRVPEGAVFVDSFNVLGANATPLSFTELYSALQLKTVDGQENPFAHVLTQKFYEVQEYLSVTSHIHSIEPFIMNKKVFDDLTLEQQKVFKDAAQEVAIWMRQYILDEEEEQLKEIGELGMKINIVDDATLFREKSQPVYDNYMNEYGWLIEEIRGALDK